MLWGPRSIHFHYPALRHTLLLGALYNITAGIYELLLWAATAARLLFTAAVPRLVLPPSCSTSLLPPPLRCQLIHSPLSVFFCGSLHPRRKHIYINLGDFRPAYGVICHGERASLRTEDLQVFFLGESHLSGQATDNESSCESASWQRA